MHRWRFVHGIGRRTELTGRVGGPDVQFQLTLQPSTANEDRGISGNESAFVLIINGENLKFPPVGTGE